MRAAAINREYDIVALARDLLLEVRASRTEIARLDAKIERLLARGTTHARRPRTAAEDATFLATLARSVGTSVFSVSELLVHMQVDPQLAGLSGRQIGNRLRGLAGRDLDGWRLERVNRDERGCNWVIVAVKLAQ